jgi:acyl-coenzyme A thioesterase PaaI-like protein
MLPAGARYISLDLDTRFIRPVTSGTGRLLCEGTVDYIGTRTALARARLVIPDGKLFAQATSNCLIFGLGTSAPSGRVAGYAPGIFRL